MHFHHNMFVDFHHGCFVIFQQRVSWLGFTEKVEMVPCSTYISASEVTFYMGKSAPCWKSRFESPGSRLQFINNSQSLT